MCHDNLEGHMRSNYILCTRMNMSLGDIEDLLPWEKTTYFYMIMEQLKQEQEGFKRSGRS